MNLHPDILTFAKSCGYVTAGIFGATGISHETIAILALLMVIDVITGIARSGKLYGWGAVTSSKMTAGIIAKLLVMLVPLVIALAGRGSGIDLRWVVSSSLTILVLAEAYSILGNIHSASTGKKTPEFDAVGYILEKFREVVENFLSNTKKK